MRIRPLAVSLLLVHVACGRRPAPPAPEVSVLPVKKRWVADVGGELRPPIVSDGTRVFVSTTESVRALDQSRGAAWTRTDISGTLAAAPGVLVVRSAKGTVAALDPATGRTRWSTDTGSAGTTAPLLDGVRIVVAGTRLVALDTASGRVALDAPVPSPAVTSPVKSPACLLVGAADGALRCHDFERGGAVWTLPMERPLDAPPIVDGDRIFVGTGDRRALALELDGSRDWRFKLGTTVPVSPAVTARHVVVASAEAVLYALGRTNGHMAWRAPLPSRPLGPPIVVGAHVLVACYPDELLAFEADSGKPAGSTRVGIERLDAEAPPSEMRTPPLLVDRTIFTGVRTQGSGWAVIALEPGAPPPPPEPPPPFPADAADEVPTPARPAANP